MQRGLFAAALVALAALGCSQPFREAWTRQTFYNSGSTWERTISAVTMPNGNFAVAGNDSQGRCFLAIHSRTAGNVTVNTLVSPTTFSSPTVVELLTDSANNLYVVGNATSPASMNGATHMVVVKLNSAGVKQWEALANFGQNGLYKTVVDAAVSRTGEVSVAGGYQKTAGTGDYDPAVAKFSATGAVVYQRVQIGGVTTEYETALGVAVDSTGRTAVNGYVGGADRKANHWIHSDTAVVSNSNYQPTPGGSTLGVRVVASPTNEFYFVGTSNNPGFGLYSLRMSNAGATLNTGFVEPVGNIVDALYRNNRIYVLMDFTSPRIQVLNSDLTPAYAATYSTGAGRNDRVIGMEVDPFGETYVAAFTSAGPSVTPAEYLLFKHNAIGTLRWATRWNPTPGTQQWPGALAYHNASGDILLAGLRTSSFPNDRVRQICYRQAPVAVNDGASLARNTVYNSPRQVTVNDRHFQGATLSVHTPPANGTLVLQGNGLYRYTPNAGFTGTDTWRYQLTKTGLTPAVGQVTMTVRP